MDKLWFAVGVISAFTRCTFRHGLTSGLSRAQYAAKKFWAEEDALFEKADRELLYLIKRMEEITSSHAGKNLGETIQKLAQLRSLQMQMSEREGMFSASSRLQRLEDMLN